ncbi:MAG: transposase [Alteromonas macleodii]
MTYIQRFGSALNLNIHFHMLFLEGAITQADAKIQFSRIKAPSHTDMDLSTSPLMSSVTELPHTWKRQG